jgi:hypothetical protein
LSARWPAAWLLAAALAGLAGEGRAASSAGFCDRQAPMSAAQQDVLLGFAAIVKGELDASGKRIALISRSGLNLERFDLRYSHAGVSLKASDPVPWSVRQLYFACDERRPRLYDQGLAGFLLGTDDPSLGYVSIVLLPAGEEDVIERAALDKARALRLIAAAYSANAYPFSLRYQNCNQWVMELLASAWGALDDAEDLRARAQRWLQDSGYAPSVVEVGSRLLMFAGGFVPWVHVDDHPEADRIAMRLRISLPDSIEAFVRARVPGAERIELCHAGPQVVVHRGWDRIDAGCRPGAQDRVVVLD